MANIVIMPKQGLQMTQGLITKWLKSEGEYVAEGEPLFEMETDKLTITIDSSFSGTLLKIIRKEDEEVPITEPIAVIGDEAEDISMLEIQAPVSAPPPEPKPEKEPKSDPVAAPPERPSVPAKPLPRAVGERVFITPRAKMRCAERGISDWSKIPGTGDNGLIVERDVLAYRIPVAAASYSRINLRVNMGESENYAAKAVANGLELTVADLINKAAELAARKFADLPGVRVKTLVGTNVEEYAPALGADDGVLLSCGGIFDGGGQRNSVFTLAFREDELEAETAAEYLSYLRTLLENTVLMLVI